MDKNAIKKYAIWARQELITRVKTRAAIYGISGGEMHEDVDSIDGKLLTRREKSQRAALIARIKQIGYDQVIEETAYTWFNRFCALRFMEVNGYLPSHVRVFTDENNAFNPQILTEAIHIEMDGLNKEIVYNLKEKNANEELYKYLLIVQCNALNAILPVMFQKIEDYTELLFPDNILREGSVIEQLIAQIPEEDWKDAVQIIGWLYQFYISVKKDEVNASKETITKETLPAVTQLFTPDWIVRYMAENSIGRMWLESYPQSALKAEMKYYVDDPVQPEEVQRKIAEIKYKEVNPIDIKIIEPCCGSGHILVYAFDLLFKMYEEKGYQAREIPTLILKNNLIGLEIDKRAAQLAYFSLMMKARSVNSRFFADRYYVAPKVRELVSSEELIEAGFVNRLRALNILSAEVLKDIEYLVEVFKYAKTIGSLLKIKPLDFVAIDAAVVKLKEDTFTNLVHTDVLYTGLPLLEQLVEQAKLLSRKYDVMITNPPYIGISTMEAEVKDYAVKNYSESKSDMFAMFMQTDFVKPNGFLAMINMHSWMFLSSYEKLRKSIITTKEIITMAHLGARAFETIGGEVVQTTTFIIRNCNYNGYGVYYRLIDPVTQEGKEQFFLSGKNIFKTMQANFSKIPGSPIAYWVSEKIINLFNSTKVRDYGYAGIGMRTGDNNRFLRLWSEIDKSKMLINGASREDALFFKSKWIPYNKGGEFRKWYGNNDYVVNWFNDGEEIKENTKKVYPYLGDNLGWKISNEKYYFKEGITWSGVTTGDFSCRLYGKGFIFDSGANGLFALNSDERFYLAGCLNTKISNMILKIINPTINTGSGTINLVPVIVNIENMDLVTQKVNSNFNISKSDWDSYETSWDFKKHPLI